MSDISSKAQDLLYTGKQKYKKWKNALMKVPEMEIKVKEATSNEAWGASGTLMHEIANGTYNFEHFRQIMDRLWKRIGDVKMWRHVYKGLLLLEFLVKNGSERVIDEARDRIHQIKMHQQFQFTDEKGVDRGQGIRLKSKQVADLLNNDRLIREERDRAKSLSKKMVGNEAQGSDASYSSGSRYSGAGGGSYGGSKSMSWEDSARHGPNRSSSGGVASSYASSGIHNTGPQYSGGGAAPPSDSESDSSSDVGDFQSPPTQPQGRVQQAPPQQAAAQPNLLDFNDAFGGPTGGTPATSTSTSSNAFDLLGGGQQQQPAQSSFFQQQQPQQQQANFFQQAPAQPQQQQQMNFFQQQQQPAAPQQQSDDLFNMRSSQQRSYSQQPVSMNFGGDGVMTVSGNNNGFDAFNDFQSADAPAGGKGTWDSGVDNLVNVDNIKQSVTEKRAEEAKKNAAAHPGQKMSLKDIQRSRGIPETHQPTMSMGMGQPSMMGGGQQVAPGNMVVGPDGQLYLVTGNMQQGMGMGNMQQGMGMGNMQQGMGMGMGMQQGGMMGGHGGSMAPPANKPSPSKSPGGGGDLFSF